MYVYILDDEWGEIPVAVVVLRTDPATTMISPEDHLNPNQIPCSI
jgi:hypothetical protein